MTYLDLITHYEDCFKKFGDTCRGVDWPNRQDAETRYRVMANIVKPPWKSATLLDFGCGASGLYQYMVNSDLYRSVTYSGLDMSAKFVARSIEKYPDNRYYCKDVLEDDFGLPVFDYVVMNGVLTEKLSMTFDEMWNYAGKLLTVLFAKTRIGLAFNVMSTHVDWERDDLFHLPLDILADFLVHELSRKFTIRNDYGLYEYTVYVYK